MTNVLVTGAGGFIGSHLCERLVVDGWNVRALCRYTSRREIGNLSYLSPEARGAIEIVFGDLGDADFVRGAVSGVDVVFHLGASISVAYSYEDPREVFKTNAEGSLNVLTAGRDAAVGRIVHMSSSEVYGTAQYTPIDEAHPVHAQSPYAASKVAADKLAETFHYSFGVPVVIARPFNNYGPRQSLRAVIPTIVAQALAGGTIRLGSTGPRRDFVYVADTVDALVALAHADNVAGETFNISTGADISVEEVVHLTGELLDRPLHVIRDDERVRPARSEVLRLLGSSRKIEEAVGWQPRTAFRDGLQDVIDWVEMERANLEPGVHAR